MMTFKQFKEIAALSEELSSVQFGIMTRDEMMMWTEEFYCECDSSDDNYYAILRDGRSADKKFDPASRGELRTAKKVTLTTGDGTWFFFDSITRNDSAILEYEVATEIMNYLWEDIDMDIEYTAEELISALKAAIASKKAA